MMKFDRIFIDDDLKINREVQYLLSHFECRPEPVNNIRQIFEYIQAAPDPISRAKKTLHVTKNKGAVIRECPGTTHYTCCDYTILHTATFCNMDCSYCILQAFFHPPVMQYFSGLKDLGKELKSIFKQNKIFRIGTGEYTDSLIWEPVSLTPKFLVEQFSKQDHCVLELKTKTVNIDSLLHIDHQQKTILSWSVNTPHIIRTQERGTAALKARLNAAQKAEKAGFKLAFHFDPLVLYPGCKAEYKNVIDLIFESIRPENIVWISLGTFRFMPALKNVIENRFPESAICYGEFILGLDNKMRYFKPLRIQLYQALIAHIKSYAPGVLTYFCMEDKKVWNESMGYYPGDKGELGRLLDAAAVRKCGLNPTLLSKGDG